MESDTYSQPNGSHHDDESPLRLVPEEDEETKVSTDLLYLQEAVWELFEDCERKLHTMPFSGDLHREKLRESFDQLHRHLLKQEGALLVKHKSSVETSIVDLETRVLSLAAMSSTITEILVKLKNKDQVPVNEEKLKALKTQLQDLSKFMVTREKSIPPLQKQEWQGIRHIITPVQKSLSFEPYSAHPNLLLSKNLKEVRYIPIPQVKKNMDWFEPGLYVLGVPELQSGQHYWEVDVGHKSNWIVGIVKKSVQRKGAQRLHPPNGFWVLRKQQDNIYYACGFLVPKLTTMPMRIGVFVDILNGYLAFYDVDTTGLIFEMYRCTFGETLAAFFCPGVPVREEDLRPLTLLPCVRPH